LDTHRSPAFDYSFPCSLLAIRRSGPQPKETVSKVCHEAMMIEPLPPDFGKCSTFDSLHGGGFDA
jgi:hypothetical protein